VFRLPVIEKDKAGAERKFEKVSERLREVEKGYEEEKALNKGLRDNLDVGKERIEKSERAVKEKEGEVEELREQVRDLMMFFEGQRLVEADPELRDASVGIAPVVEEGKKESPGKKASLSKRKGKKR
jgi:BRCA1-associated protein